MSVSVDILHITKAEAHSLNGEFSGPFGTVDLHTLQGRATLFLPSYEAAQSVADAINAAVSPKLEAAE